MNEEMIAAGLLTLLPDAVKTAMRDLKENPIYCFDRLIDVTAVDRNEVFEVVYHLNSLKYDKDLVVKVEISREKPEVASVTDLWLSAMLGEREVQDMFGIVFAGHPDPRPLLAPEDGFGFFPLRKDYKLPGRTGQQDGR
jgi:NADH-quinone oxidoreductase subunit C